MTTKKQMYSLFPQGPLTAEVPKAVGKIGLVASAFEAKCGAEASQCRFAHLVTVSANTSISIECQYPK